MIMLTYGSIKMIIESACGDAVPADAKETISQQLHNVSIMWGLSHQQCEDLCRMARNMYWRGMDDARCGEEN